MKWEDVLEWDDKNTTKKGNIFEKARTEDLEQKGKIVYETKTKGGHPTDKFIFDNKTRELIIEEQKGKARRNIYPDSGVDLYQYNKLLNDFKETGIKKRLAFGDEYLEKVYGNFFDYLNIKREIEYEGTKQWNREHIKIILKYPFFAPINKKGERIIYFPLCSMKFFAKLSKEQIKEMKKNNTRKYKFNPNTNEKITIINSEIKEEVGKVFRKNNCEFLF